MSFIGILSILLGILSLFSLFSSSTPISKFVYKYILLTNDKVEYFFKYYKIFLLLSLLALGLFIIYLIWMVIDFYSANSFFISIPSLTCTSAILWMFLPGKGFTKILIELGIKQLVILLLFVGIYSLLYNISLTSDKLKYEYFNLYKKSEYTQTSLLSLKTSNSFEGLIHNYNNYVIFASKLNKIIHLYNVNKVVLDFKKIEENPTLKIIYLKNDLIVHIRNNFPKKYQETLILKAKATLRVNEYKVSFFPAEIQPYYISAIVIEKYSIYFSQVAISIKIWITVFFHYLGNISYLLYLIIGVVSLVLLSFLLSKNIASYNLKYNPEIKISKYHYSISFITILSILLGLYALT